MARHRKLSRPPLREALIDIRIAGDLPVSVISPDRRPRLEGFQKVRPMTKVEASIEFGHEKPSQALVKKDEPHGWRFEKEDASAVVQLRRDGMTYSILRNYTDWSNIRTAAENVWTGFGNLALPFEVSRLALRYINVLQLPLGEVDLDEYLTAGPRIPVELPQGLIGFLHKVAIPLSDGITAVVTQALEQPTETNMSVVLDIDVYCERTLKGNSPEIWGILDKLREMKNMIFFSSVTEKALENC